MGASTQRSWRLFVSLFLVIGISAPAFYINRPFHVDEALFLVAGRELHRGATLYVDVIDHKPPGIFLLAAGIASLPAEQYILARVATYLTHAATAVLVVLLGRRIRNPSVGMVGGLLFLVGVYLPHFDGFHFLTEPFAIFLMSLAALLLLSDRRGSDVVAGLALGIAVLFNQTVFLMGFSIIALVVLRFRYRQEDARTYLWEVIGWFTRIGAGFVVPLLAVGAYLAREGTLGAMVRYSVYLPLTSYSTPFALRGHVLAFVTYLPVWLLVAGALVVLAYRYLDGEFVHTGTLLMALWFLVLVVPGAKGFNGDHKLLFAFPPAAVLAAIALCDLFAAHGIDSLRFREPLSAGAVRGQVMAAVFVSVLVLGLFTGSNGLYAYHLADDTVADQMNDANQVSESVNGPVYILPFHQELVYFGDGVEPANVYLGAVYGEALPREVIAQLEAKNVTYVIVARHLVTENGTIDGETGFFPESRGMVASYVEQEYEYYDETERYVIFHRK